MKKCILFILCLHSFVAFSQWEDVKDSAYYAIKEKQRIDSIETATKDIITDRDRELARIYEGSISVSKYNSPCERAYLKIQRIEFAQKKRTEDSVFQIKQKQYEIAERKERTERFKNLTKKYGSVVAKKLMEEKVWLGMTDKMVIDEFGDADIKRAVTANGVTETWTYLPSSFCIGRGCPVLDYYMVFKNHRLVALGDL